MDSESGNQLEVRLSETIASSRLTELCARHGRNLRKVPGSEQAEETVAQIIASAKDLLAGQEIRRITTKRIAEHAEVNIATLYRYFLDIDAILWEIAVETETRQVEQMSMLALPLAGADDWRPILDGMVDAMVADRLDNPEGVRMVEALRTIEELKQIVDAGWTVGAQLMAIAFHARQPKLSLEDWEAITLTITPLVRLGIDLACLPDPPDMMKIEVLKAMIERTLSPWLDGKTALSP